MSNEVTTLVKRVRDTRFWNRVIRTGSVEPVPTLNDCSLVRSVGHSQRVRVSVALRNTCAVRHRVAAKHRIHHTPAVSLINNLYMASAAVYYQ